MPKKWRFREKNGKKWLQMEENGVKWGPSLISGDFRFLTWGGLDVSRHPRTQAR